jgi:hypothetical protein
MSFTVTTWAGEVSNPQGKFSIWLPDSWEVTQSGNRVLAQNPKDSIEVVVGPLKDPNADLTDEDVTDFVDDELDAMKVAKDEKVTQASRPARRLEGTGADGDDDIEFRAVAIDPAEKEAVIEALVMIDHDIIDREQMEKVVEHILRSFKPQ